MRAPSSLVVVVILFVGTTSLGCDGESSETVTASSSEADGSAKSPSDGGEPWSIPTGAERRDASAGTPSSEPDASVSARDSAMNDASSMASPCVARTERPPLDETRTLEHDGSTRTFYVHVPATYDFEPTPLVFDFHGYISNARQQADFSNMIAKSDESGFVAVHAEGTGQPQRWNAGNCCPDGRSDIDDVGFVLAMIDTLSQELCIDPKRIYSTGLSNGGMLSYRLACEHGDRIAAIAPVSASLVYRDCSPSRGVPVLQFHGTRDNVNPYRNASDSVRFWTTRLGCSDDSIETFSEGDTTCETWQSCRDEADVTFCTVDGGGHTWPGGDVPSLLGHTTRAIDATDAIWDFFVAHPLP